MKVKEKGIKEGGKDIKEGNEQRNEGKRRKGRKGNGG